MLSVNHLNDGADLVRHIVDHKLKEVSVTTKELSPSEAGEAKIAKQKAMSALSAMVRRVDKTLSKIKSGPSAQVQSFKPAVNKTKAQSAADIVNLMSKSGMGDPSGPNETLDQMAQAIGPVMDSFNTIVGENFLNSFSATANTAPIVGLKGQQIYYVNSFATGGDGTTDSWAVFGSLPPGVTVGPTDKVIFFPFQGDFYVAINRAIWMKQHRKGDGDDPALANAVDDWPNMYVDDWTKVGAEALPDTDIVNIVPYEALAKDGTALDTHLVLFLGNGSLQALDGQTIQQTNSFSPMVCQNSDGTPAVPPTWTQMAYYSGDILALDNTNNLYSLSPTFNPTGNSYTFSVEETNIEPLTQFTASDTGPVGVGADGFLHRRLVIPPKASGDPTTTSWEKWVPLNGVRCLGVASPGVLLDMRYLTLVLRSRYIDTQTAIYPIVNQIQSFAKTHKFFLDLLKQDSDAFIAAGNDQQKQQIALNAGKLAVNHASTWAQILKTTTSTTSASVQVMSRQLEGINTQLGDQLERLKTKLAGLQHQLDGDKDELQKLDAALWGSIAAIFLGMFVFFVGVATANPFIVAAGGALFAGGIIATGVLGSKAASLASQISGEQDQVDVVSTSVDELTTIRNQYVDLFGAYTQLNDFWLGLFDDAQNLNDMDDAVAIEIGSNSLADPSAILAAMQVTDEMVDATTTYLSVLNKQGIRVGTASTSARVSHEQVSLSADKATLPDHVHVQLEQAGSELRSESLEAYMASMKKAVNVQLMASDVQKLSDGSWFTLSALRQTADIWTHGSAGALFARVGSFKTVATSRNGLIAQLDKIKPGLMGMLSSTLDLATLLQKWASEFPAVPTTKEDQDMVKALQTESLTQCGTAQDMAARANNSFVDFNSSATNFQTHLEGLVKDQQQAISSANSQFAETMRAIGAPRIPFRGGRLDGHEAQTDVNQTRLNAKQAQVERDNTVARCNAQISTFQADMASTVTLNGETQSWVQTVQGVSGRLGAVYDLINNVQGPLIENPPIYKALMETEWSQVISDIKAVQTMLQ